MKNKIILISLIFIIFSCGNWGPEEIIINHEPMLNIFAHFSSTSAKSNFVKVAHTISISDPEYVETDSLITEYTEFWVDGDTLEWNYYYYKPTYVIENANVFAINSNSDTIDFQHFSEGVYLPNDTTFLFNANEEYSLTIITDSFDVATGNVTIAEKPEFTITDTIFHLDENDWKISWTDINDFGYDVKMELDYDSTFYTDTTKYFYFYFDDEVEENEWSYDSTEFMFYNPFKEFPSDTIITWITVKSYSEYYDKYFDVNDGMGIGYITMDDFYLNINNALGAIVSSAKSDSQKVVFIK
ncbi:MAG: hypothetical protein U9N76_07370 [Candidatus Marinimicrobia bacterium]|nr:hypothetical protein [Candidatus Neomarinimicrobiota bacterium]